MDSRVWLISESLPRIRSPSSTPSDSFHESPPAFFLPSMIVVAWKSIPILDVGRPTAQVNKPISTSPGLNHPSSASGTSPSL